MTERQRVAHLLRRAGFGATRAELAAFESLGFAGAVERLMQPPPDDPADLTARTVASTAMELYEIQDAWLMRMLTTAQPLREKLTYFWHDHFATGMRKVQSLPLMWRQNTTLRSGALGRFGDLVLAVAKDPAMLVWLDGARNVRRSPNENFAREFLELFTTGPGPYTELDIREAARAFTGWSVEGETRDVYEFTMRESRHDTGMKTFLGETGAFDGEDVVRIAVAHPATSQHIAGKLFELLVYPNPTAATVQQFAEVFRATDGDIAAVVRAILLSPEFSSDRAYRALVRSPVEFTIAAFKALEAIAIPEWAWRQMRRMGQELFSPPNVGGWDHGEAWLNPQTVVERMAFAARLVFEAEVELTALRPETYSGMAQSNPDQVVTEFVNLILAGDLDADQQASLVDYLRIDRTTSERRDPTELAVGRVRGLVQLLLSSPAAQLA